MTDERAHSETTAQPPDWDARAAGFDEEPDHGLRDPAVRAAWAAGLRSWLPGHPADVLDLGCGTGSVSLLAAQQLPPVPQQPGPVGRCPPHLADEDHVEAAFPHRRGPAGPHRTSTGCPASSARARSVMAEDRSRPSPDAPSRPSGCPVTPCCGGRK